MVRVELGAAQASTASRAARTERGAAGFSAALAQASATPAQASGSASLARASASRRAPEGEVTEPVSGHKGYVDIIAGPRNGLYLNVSGNSRDGETFSIVERGGRTFHVYGSGRDREVVPVRERPATARPDEGEAPARRETAPAEETTAPVAGHRYADITAGPRNGMYLNTSGNARDGQAFVLVRRGEREYHIYGSGEDRLVVVMRRLPGDPDEGDGVAAGRTRGAESGTTGTRTTGATLGNEHSAPA